MTNQSRLIPISYYNKTQEVRLSAYADTIVYEQESRQKTLRAIRFGGYPEMVRAMHLDNRIDFGTQRTREDCYVQNRSGTGGC